MRALFLLFLLSIIGCGSGPEFELPPPSSTRLPSEGDAPYYVEINNLGFSLLQGIDYAHSIVFSPVAISHDLAVVMNGSSNKVRESLMGQFSISESNRDAFNASQRALINQSSQSQDLRFSYGTGVFAVWPVVFDKAFTEKMKANYGATVMKLGGATIEGRRMLDEWARERSRNAVDGLGHSLSLDQQLLAASVASYMDPAEGTVTSSDYSVKSGSDDLVDAVSVSRRDGIYSVVYLVPKPKVTIDIFIHDLHRDRWNSLVSKMSVYAGGVSTDALDVDDLIDLAKAETWSGWIPPLFGDECNLRPMAAEMEHGFSISAMPHRTRVHIPALSVGAEPITVKAPFVFAVVENKTGVICVLGVKNPD